MTSVNPIELARVLGLQSPGAFEDFIADLLVAEHPGATQTNPGGGGDGGIDVRLEADEGWRIWQIKAFHAPLNKSQMNQVKASIDALVKRRDDKDDDLALVDYELITAWTPNDLRLRVFHANAAKLGCPARWSAAALIRGLVAKHPHIYDALKHGDAHLDRFVQERAILAGTAVGPDLPGFQDAVVLRQRKLKDLESLQRGPYRVETSHLSLRQGGDVLDIVKNLEGVMHRVQYLDNGKIEIQSVIPQGAAAQGEPITLSASIAKAELESNPAARDWAFWGKAPADLEMEVQVTGGPFADDEPVSARATLIAQGTRPLDAPPLTMEVSTPEGKRVWSMRIDVLETSIGPIGGGRRIVGRSESGAVDFEFRMGSTEAPEVLSFELNLDGGQRPSDYLEELEGVSSISSDMTIEFTVRGQRLAKGTNFVAPEATSEFIEVAAMFTEWSAIAKERIVMPRLADLTGSDVNELRDVAQGLRQEFEPRKWQGLAVTVADPEAAAATIAAAQEKRFLARSWQVGFTVGGVRVDLPRVLVDTYSGIVFPSPETIRTAAPGTKLELKAEEGALVTRGLLVDDSGNPVERLV